MVQHAVALVAWAVSGRSREPTQYSPVRSCPSVAPRYPTTAAFCSAGSSPNEGRPAEEESAPPQARSRRRRPTLKKFNKKLNRYAKRGEATDAEALLEKMHALYSAGDLSAPPDIISYGSVMDALARSRDDDASERAEALSTRLVTYAELGGTTRPNLLFFNALLNCYAERGKADEATTLLDTMHDLHAAGQLDGGPPDPASYGAAIKALGNSRSIKRRPAVERAEALLDRFENQEEKEGGALLSNCQMYVSVLRLYARWGLGNEAEQLLERMHDVDRAGRLEDGPPNIIAYTAALNAWAKSKDRDATRRAEALVRRLEEDVEWGSDIRPDVITFNTLLRCYAARGMAHEAELLLMKMERLYTAGKLGNDNRWGRHDDDDDGGGGPDKISYTTVLTAMAKSDAADATERAVALLDQMRQLHAEGRQNMTPDVVTYACVIRCVLRGQDHWNVTPFEQADILQKLQIEEWPFARDQDIFPWN